MVSPAVLEPPQRAMPHEANLGTKTVRIAGEAANRLQTIATLKQEMGEKFSPVTYLNGLVEKPIEELHAEVTARYAEFLKKKKRPKS